VTARRRRLIVVPIIRRDDGRYLVCKMPAHRGVYPGQWGLPGGGVEDDERIEDALRREVREELQLELATMQPVYFKADDREKLYPDGRRETMYMVFLIYGLLAASESNRVLSSGARNEDGATGVNGFASGVVTNALNIGAASASPRCIGSRPRISSTVLRALS
jgi:nucleoside triphosphatase